MITVGQLRKLLATLPSDAMCYGYEGEDTGIGIRSFDENERKQYWWIRARETDEEDDQPEFREDGLAGDD